MATNNYFGFTHGGTQYSAAAATGAAYQASQAGYAVAPAAAATYGTQRAATGYDTTAYQTAATTGTYAAVGAGTGTAYDYGYGRAATGYDASKTYYQQAAATPASGYAAAATGYEQAAPKQTYSTGTYTQRATTQAQQTQQASASKASQYSGAYQTTGTTAYQANNYTGQTAQSTTVTQPVAQQAKRKETAAAAAVAAANTTYSGYDAALYSAATMYVAQQSGNTQGGGKQSGWQGYKKGPAGVGVKNIRPKPPPKPQQLHYCDVCKISCAGPQTYREHLEGQKHKKREAALKLTATVASTVANRSGNSLLCELCDVTCTGNDAYAAHIRGAKHQKVVKLHTKLGKPIPSTEPQVIGGSAARKTTTGTPKINFVQSGGLGISSGNGDVKNEDGTATASEEEVPEPDIQPVGQDYLEEIKSEDGKVVSFNCKLCECRFNDPNAKEMHMKGRRHRLQYKKKVNPDLVVDLKPSLRQRKIQEEKQRRQAMREEYWQRRHMAAEDEAHYWEEQRRFEEDYMDWFRRAGGVPPFGGPRGRPPFPGGPVPPPFFQGPPMGRRPESADDRHVHARHNEIYPKEEELQAIQRIVSHTERALKIVSDQLAAPATGTANNKEGATTTTTNATNTTASPTTTAPATTPTPTAAKEGEKTEGDKPAAETKEDGRDNQLFSFQREDKDTTRVLKGVMRVGHLAKGLLLRGDTLVRLVVLCAEKPTLTLLRKVCELLPAALKQVAADRTYNVQMAAAEAGLTVTEDALTVQVSLTSPVMREQDGAAATSGSDRDVLARGKCLQALAALRHAKWFQARAQGLQSCVIVIRILRDLCQRVPTWAPLNSWAMELLVEKVISSVGQIPMGPGDALRRVLEAVAGGLLLPNGPGLADPCEKDTPDATAALTAQQREDITASAQSALRLVAYRQIHKVLGMDPLPPPKFQRRPMFPRKRRRSGGEQADSEADSGKMVKKEEDNSVKTETVAAPTA